MTDHVSVDKRARSWLDMKPGSYGEAMARKIGLVRVARLGPSQEILDEIFTKFVPPRGAGYVYAVEIAGYGVSPEVLDDAIIEFLRKAAKSTPFLKNDHIKTAEKLAKLRLGREELTDKERKEAR